VILTRLDEQVVTGMLPGQHVIVLSGDPVHALEGRRLGLELRDTILVLSVGQTDFAFLFRREPEGTVAANVLRYGVGGLNIDGCRVGWGRDKPSQDEWNDKGAGGRSNHFGQVSDGLRQAYAGGKFKVPAGRWPTNLVLVHGPECVRVGHKSVRNVGGDSSGKSAFGLYSGWNKHNNRVTKVERYRDEDGLETVAAWTCQDNCPVLALDQQSGEIRVPGSYLTADRGFQTMYGGNLPTPDVHIGNGDSGGASHFFPQFAGQADLLGWLGRLIGQTS